MINESLKNAFKEMWKNNLNLLDISESNLNSHIHDDNPHHITPYMIGAASYDHTHHYAGSSSVGGSAASAVKLDTTTAGDSNTPVYFSGGKPVACTSLDLDTSGNAATATKLKNSGMLDTQEKIDGFIAANAIQYATFKTTDSNNVGMQTNDGMIISIPWTSSSYGSQLAFDDSQAATIKVRGYSSGWSDWKTLLNSSNYTDYTVKKDGTGASGTWGIGISGNAATATALTTSAGSATNPIYFSNGKPAACTYTLGKSVPSDAKFTDTVYTHPTSSGNKHIPSGGSSGQILRWSSDGTAVWGADNNTTYSNATTSTDGLMSSSDKTKLDGIATGATKITVDSALSSTSTNPVQNKVIYGAISSKADLDTSGKVLSSQLPSYVDDVLEYSAKSNFPSTGESGKIYVDTATNLTYRWSGSTYVEISQSLALGETSSTAYRGDRGKIAYDHSQASHAPTNAEVNQNAFSNVKVGSTTVSADSKTDTLELVAGTNVTLTPDATNDKVTITTNDTKNTAGSTDTNDKIFLVGATSQAANPQTYSHDTAYVGADGCLYSNNTKVSVNGHTHNYAGSSSAGGAATSANKLTTAKTIALGTGVAGTATSFDGSNNITIPVTSVKEAYLDWGGRSISEGVTPIGAALSSEHSANRLAYLTPNAIAVEYSNDAGSTWVDYDPSSGEKVGLVTTNSGIHIGNASTVTTSLRTRITITARDNTAEYLCTRPHKLLLRVESPGPGISVTIETKTGVSGATWSTVGTYILFNPNSTSRSPFKWNDIPLDFSSLGEEVYLGGGVSDVWQMRLTFAITSGSGNYSRGPLIRGIRLFGDDCLTPTSNMGETGHLYSYDTNQDAIFPSEVYARSFVGNLEASNITAGTLGGRVVANATAVGTLTTKQLRNITISTADPTSSDGGNGDVWIKYGSTQSNCPFPVGGIYISIASTSPSSIWAGTGWEEFAKGKTLVGLDSSDSDFNTIGKTGGKKTHKLTPDEIPAHGHGMAHTHSYTGPNTGSWKVGTNGKAHTWCTSAGGKTSGGASKTTTDNAGGSLEHNNLQPYIVVYMWKRVS